MNRFIYSFLFVFGFIILIGCSQTALKKTAVNPETKNSNAQTRQDELLQTDHDIDKKNVQVKSPDLSSTSRPDHKLNPREQTDPQSRPEKVDQIQDNSNSAASAAKSKADKPANDENQVNTESVKELKPEKNEQLIIDEALDFCRVAQAFWQKGELENALEALDKAYSLILKVDSSSEAKLIQQKEDIRFLISKRILEIYASRNIVVNGNYNAIPMVMNKYIQAELKLFTKGPEKQFFINAYKRSGKYLPYINKTLKENGLPAELAWIPLIESGFKVKALSRARALGLWQFIPSTGYKFGLNRNKFVDERIDFIKSTNAAIAYLKELHSIFGDWATVLAAYNCGEGRVLRVIRTQKVNYLDNFWDLYQRLPRETARYVPRFLATLHILNNKKKYGLDNIIPSPSLEFETVEVMRQVRLKDIALKTEIPHKLLSELNPELRYGILPPDKYLLRIPPKKKEVLIAGLNQIPLSAPPRRAFVYHRIRSGETLSTIARRYRTGVRSIMRANNLRRSNFIVAGKKLKIPLKGVKISQIKKPKQKSTGKASTHFVRSGDSLWIIARRYHTTTRKIQGLNNLHSSRLYVGQALKIPGKALPLLSSTRNLNTYYVKRGDSPYTIAKRHQMTLEKFLRINHLTPRNKIFPGQKLVIE